MGRVYYFVEQGRIAGGIKVAYRHVATLRRHGIDAVVVHARAERPAWFPVPDVPVLAVAGLSFTADDVVVLAEDARHSLRHPAIGPARKVVFCQNHFYLAGGLHGAPDLRRFGVEAVVTSGDVITAFIRRRLPGLPVATVHLAIDPALYRPAPAKALQVAVIPRKRPHEFRYIRDLLRHEHPDLCAIRWVVLENAREDQVAHVMAESAVFLSLARLEGVGLTGLEAMACGCAVTGFLGDGGREFATPDNGWWARDEDCEDAVRQLAACLAAVRDGTAAPRIAAGRATAARYTPQREEAELLAFWRGVLGRPVTADGWTAPRGP
ncbi:glycosyltransferase [Azospirillum halopraeferens]|uniref:glycosyltransferase n=1 Tax=Azospirillum halopraeferens TaxID=34010 RepID=UPI00040CECA2|nr:glycosyltransferase [Azospirillum halopraeferens]